MKNQKEFKYNYTNYASKKESEKVLFPFRRKRDQQNASIFIIVIAFLFMVGSPILSLGKIYTISGFSLGAILGIIGLLYLFDSV